MVVHLVYIDIYIIYIDIIYIIYIYINIDIATIDISKYINVLKKISQWQKKYFWDMYQKLLKWKISLDTSLKVTVVNSIYINLKNDSYALRKKSFFKRVSDIIKMRYINIFNTQIGSSYININKRKGDSYSLTIIKKNLFVTSIR